MSSRVRTTATRFTRPALRLALAAALVVSATAAVRFDASAVAPEQERSATVRTVTVTPADAVPLEVPAETPLTASLTEAVVARTSLVAEEPAPQPGPGTTPLEVWDRLAQCESGQNWSINTGNGFYGGLQFTLESWRWVGGEGYPHHASKQEQIRRAEILLDRQGWVAWPACSRKIGLR